MNATESKVSHTPGPWTVAEEIDDKATDALGYPLIWVHGQEQVCMVPNGDDESNANASLIAAAPDLLAALEGCIHHDNALKAEYKIPANLRRIIEAAIAKATT